MHKQTQDFSQKKDSLIHLLNSAQVEKKEVQN